MHESNLAILNGGGSRKQNSFQINRLYGGVVQNECSLIGVSWYDSHLKFFVLQYSMLHFAVLLCASYKKEPQGEV